MRLAGDSPLRFCMISIYYPPYGFGGDAIFVQRLSEELAERGHQVDVIHPIEPYRLRRSRADPAAFPPTRSVTIHRLETSLGLIGPLAAHQSGRPWLERRAIERVLASKPFDVIHYHNISLLGPGVFEMGQARVKLYTAHDHWLVCPLSVLWKNRERACERPECWTCLPRSGRPPQWWRNSGRLARSAEAVNVFFAPSRFCERMLAERGFARELTRLEYFLPEPERTAESSVSPHRRPYFLYVGRLEKYKGVQDLLEPFRGPGDYDLLIVGDGAYEARLRELARGLERVRFVGWLNQNALDQYYRHALAAVAPSLTYETFGMVVIEALARGTPVVVRDLGALPETAGDGGVVFQNTAELAAALQRLYADAELRRRLGEAGRRRYTERWTPDAHLAKYLDVIERQQSLRIESRSA